MSNKVKNFKRFFNEETTSSDIATVDTKMDMKRRDHKSKGKKCKKHKRLNCEACAIEEENKYE